MGEPSRRHFALVYCDFIQDLVVKELRSNKYFRNIKLQFDLHPTEHYMLSTKKTVECEDGHGTRYKITIEENRS